VRSSNEIDTALPSSFCALRIGGMHAPSEGRPNTTIDIFLILASPASSSACADADIALYRRHQRSHTDRTRFITPPPRPLNCRASCAVLFPQPPCHTNPSLIQPRRLNRLLELFPSPRITSLSFFRNAGQNLCPRRHDAADLTFPLYYLSAVSLLRFDLERAVPFHSPRCAGVRKP